jgi:hypothetical protein
MASIKTTVVSGDLIFACFTSQGPGTCTFRVNFPHRTGSICRICLCFVPGKAILLYFGVAGISGFGRIHATAPENTHK